MLELTVYQISSFINFVCFLQNDPSKLDNFGRAMLHGKGYDRWFDKSFTLVVASNGRVFASII